MVVAGLVSVLLFPRYSANSLEKAVVTAGRDKLPEGFGLSAKYPGDKGIERDPAVVFVENFEEGSLEAIKSRWENCSGIEIMSLSGDAPPGSAGKHSLLMTHIGGKGTGGHLYRRLLPGYEELYVRFYVKFDPQCGPIHHFFHLGVTTHPLLGHKAGPESGREATKDSAPGWSHLAMLGFGTTTLTGWRCEAVRPRDGPGAIHSSGTPT
ncbi:MAG: hypothetical protein ABIK18_02115 [candidate division WOR-3 bacterium]